MDTVRSARVTSHPRRDMEQNQTQQRAASVTAGALTGAGSWERAAGISSLFCGLSDINLALGIGPAGKIYTAEI